MYDSEIIVLELSEMYRVLRKISVRLDYAMREPRGWKKDSALALMDELRSLLCERLNGKTLADRYERTPWEIDLVKGLWLLAEMLKPSVHESALSVMHDMESAEEIATMYANMMQVTVERWMENPRLMVADQSIYRC